jgi:hypothetical protein
MGYAWLSAATSAAASAPSTIPSCRKIASARPVMSQLNIQTFRALTMIMASFGLHLPISGHDHEKARPAGIWAGPAAGTIVAVGCRALFALG